MVNPTCQVKPNECVIKAHFCCFFGFFLFITSKYYPKMTIALKQFPAKFNYCIHYQSSFHKTCNGLAWNLINENGFLLGTFIFLFFFKKNENNHQRLFRNNLNINQSVSVEFQSTTRSLKWSFHFGVQVVVAKRNNTWKCLQLYLKLCAMKIIE